MNEQLNQFFSALPEQLQAKIMQLPEERRLAVVQQLMEKYGQSTAQPAEAAYGMNAQEVGIEAEGNENLTVPDGSHVPTPNGGQLKKLSENPISGEATYEISGHSHEQGGIDLDLKPESVVNSDKMKIGTNFSVYGRNFKGKTFKEASDYLSKKEESIQKKFNKDRKDGAVDDTYESSVALMLAKASLNRKNLNDLQEAQLEIKKADDKHEYLKKNMKKFGGIVKETERNFEAYITSKNDRDMLKASDGLGMSIDKFNEFASKIDKNMSVQDFAKEFSKNAPKLGTSGMGTISGNYKPVGKISGSMKERAVEAANFFVSKGYSPSKASAIVGNLMQESNLNPTITNSIGAFGIAQWYKDRRVNFERWAESQGKSKYDFNTQLEYVHHELQTSHKGANQALLSAKSLEDEVLAIRKKYEIPGEHEAQDGRRRDYAQFVMSNIQVPAPQQGYTPYMEHGGYAEEGMNIGNMTPDEVALYNEYVSRSLKRKFDPHEKARQVLLMRDWNPTPDEIEDLMYEYRDRQFDLPTFFKKNMYDRLNENVMQPGRFEPQPTIKKGGMYEEYENGGRTKAIFGTYGNRNPSPAGTSTQKAAQNVAADPNYGWNVWGGDLYDYQKYHGAGTTNAAGYNGADLEIIKTYLENAGYDLEAYDGDKNKKLQQAIYDYVKQNHPDIKINEDAINVGGKTINETFDGKFGHDWNAAVERMFMDIDKGQPSTPGVKQKETEVTLPKMMPKADIPTVVKDLGLEPKEVAVTPNAAGEARPKGQGLERLAKGMRDASPYLAAARRLFEGRIPPVLQQKPYQNPYENLNTDYDIQSSLNEIDRQILTGDATGNPSVRNARMAQIYANASNAKNQLYSQKYNQERQMENQKEIGKMQYLNQHTDTNMAYKKRFETEWLQLLEAERQQKNMALDYMANLPLRKEEQDAQIALGLANSIYNYDPITHQLVIDPQKAYAHAKEQKYVYQDQQSTIDALKKKLKQYQKQEKTDDDFEVRYGKRIK